MCSSAATNVGEVRPEEGSVPEVPDPVEIAEVLSLVKQRKFVLPALQRIVDAILIQTAVEINYSSIHSYHLIRTGTRNQDHPLAKEDILVGGCWYPNMDCVGSAYFLRHKILSIWKQFDEESIFQFEASLIVVASKVEGSLQLLCLHRVDKKILNGFAPAEHVALTISMNNWHLLMDVGKIIMSILLTPGEEAESILMIRLVLLVENKSNALFARNDIDAASMK